MKKKMIYKSVKINAVLNASKVIVSLIFSMITYSYMLRVLQIESVGKINFYITFISYFQLIATLGIQTYAICEGSGQRFNQEKINKFSSQMYSINIIMTLIVYIILGILVASIQMFRENWFLIVILSSSILSNAVGVEWLFSIFEDYLYITIRYILIQIFNVILIFLLVKTPNDYILYAFISVFPMAILNIFNRIYAKQYCSIKLTIHTNIRQYILPLLTIFAANTATIIYLDADITMLGIINGDRYVGLYTLPAKIYSMLKNIMGAVVIVTIPKIKIYWVNKRYQQHKDLISEIFSILVILLLPISIGVFCLSDEIILFLAGKNFIGGAGALKILSISMLFAVLNGLNTSAILIPLKKEKVVMFSTIIAAILNIILNVGFLPQFKHIGAAITTLIAEALIFSITIFYSRKFLDVTIIFKNTKSVVLIIPFVILSASILKLIISNILIRIFCLFLVSIIFYITILLTSKNYLIEFILNFLKNRRGKI